MIKRIVSSEYLVNTHLELSISDTSNEAVFKKLEIDFLTFPSDFIKRKIFLSM